MTPLKLLLLPLFLHVLLVLWIGLRTVRARIASVKSGKVKLGEIATDNSAWPTEARKLSNNFDNQFDVPMLWYAACALIAATGLADAVGVFLSWLFLLLRVAHSVIHTGKNNVPRRMRVFLAGFAAVFMLWLWFGLRLFVIG